MHASRGSCFSAFEDELADLNLDDCDFLRLSELGEEIERRVSERSHANLPTKSIRQRLNENVVASGPFNPVDVIEIDEAQVISNFPEEVYLFPIGFQRCSYSPDILNILGPNECFKEDIVK